MNDAGFVRGDERARHLDRHFERFLHSHRSARETLAQSFALDQFARDVVRRAILADLVDRQDIWMIERDDGARFLFETSQPRSASPVKRSGQEFERGFAPRDDVGGQIDLAHPAGADPFARVRSGRTVWPASRSGGASSEESCVARAIAGVSMKVAGASMRGEERFDLPRAEARRPRRPCRGRPRCRPVP